MRSKEPFWRTHCVGTILATYAVVIAVFVVSCLCHYGGEPYEIDQATDWLWRARATNDLTDMAKYLNESLAGLAQFEGNPNWMFPRPDTEFALIKGNIAECITNCLIYSELTNDMAYQQAVNNLQETIVEICEHLSIAGTWVWWTPVFTVWTTAAMVFLTLGWFVMLVRWG